MKVRITTSVAGLDFSITPGTVVDWPEAQAIAWVRAGKAVPVTEGERTDPKPADKIKHIGGGWYEVRGQKVQGKDDALKLLNDE